MENNIEQIVVFLINIIGFYISFIVYGANKKDKLNQWFVAMTFFVVMWVDFAFLGYRETNILWSEIYYKINWSFVSLFMIAFFYFYIIHFINHGRGYNKLRKLVYYLGVIFALLSIFTDSIIKETIIREWGAEIIFGPVNDFFNFYTLIVSILVIYLLVKKYFGLPEEKVMKAHYFITGTVMFVLLNILFNIISPVITGTVAYQHIGDYSAIFLIGFTAYAITKHELMGIKTLITQVLIAIMSIILVVDIFLLSSDVLTQTLKVAVLITFLYFSRELVKSVKKEKEARSELEKAYEQINRYVDQLEDMNTDLVERNEDLKALLEASGRAIEELDSKKIAQEIVNSIPKSLKHLGYIGGIIILYDKNAKTISTYAITESKIVKKAKGFLSKSFDEYRQNLESADNFTVRTIREKKIFSGESLVEFISPMISKTISNIIQKTVKAKSFISIPLFSRGSVVGTILFVGKKPIEKIVQRDKDMLYMFSSHIGGAIENARLYEQTNIQMKELAILNENLKHANENLKEAMEVKNEFLHITSHQLRTPLTAIRGMLSMWYEGDFDNLPESERKKILKRIYLSAERLNNITNDMLDALEIEGGLLKFQFTDVSLKKIIKETIDTLKPNYDKKGLYIKFKSDADIPTVKVEPNYIRQVFMNVIDNASKYTREGGVEISLKSDGKYVNTIVKDTGVGVSEDDQRRMFEKFTRGKNAIKENVSGSGLGLFIAKKIVEKHHGKMKFMSEGVGKGSTVTISLISIK